MKILFVCTGNTCRSCMAEAIFNSENKDSSISASSAGMCVVNDSKTSQNAVVVVKNKINIDLSERKAMQLTEDMLREADIIFAMTSSIKYMLSSTYPEFKSKINTLNDYAGIEGDIIDPYGGSIDIYEKTFRDLKNSILLLLNKLKEDTSIS